MYILWNPFLNILRSRDACSLPYYNYQWWNILTQLLTLWYTWVICLPAACILNPLRISHLLFISEHIYPSTLRTYRYLNSNDYKTLYTHSQAPWISEEQDPAIYVSTDESLPRRPCRRSWTANGSKFLRNERRKAIFQMLIIFKFFWRNFVWNRNF